MGKRIHAKDLQEMQKGFGPGKGNKWPKKKRKKILSNLTGSNKREIIDYMRGRDFQNKSPKAAVIQYRKEKQKVIGLTRKQGREQKILERSIKPEITKFDPRIFKIKKQKSDLFWQERNKQARIDAIAFSERRRAKETIVLKNVRIRMHAIENQVSQHNQRIGANEQRIISLTKGVQRLSIENKVRINEINILNSALHSIDLRLKRGEITLNKVSISSIIDEITNQLKTKGVFAEKIEVSEQIKSLKQQLIARIESGDTNIKKDFLKLINILNEKHSNIKNEITLLRQEMNNINAQNNTLVNSLNQRISVLEQSLQNGIRAGQQKIIQINKQGGSPESIKAIEKQIEEMKKMLEETKKLVEGLKKPEKEGEKAAAKKKFALGSILGSIFKSMGAFGGVAALVVLGFVLATMFANSMNQGSQTTTQVIQQPFSVESAIQFSPILIAGVAIALIALWYFLKKKD